MYCETLWSKTFRRPSDSRAKYSMHPPLWHSVSCLSYPCYLAAICMSDCSVMQNKSSPSETNRCRDIQMQKQTDAETYRCRNRQMQRHTDAETYRCRNRQMLRQTDAETDTCRYRHMQRQTDSGRTI